MMLSSKPRSWLYLVLRVGGSVLILSLLLHFLPLEQLRRALGRLPPGLWLFVLAGYLGAHSIGVLKWRLMVNLAGAHLTLAQAGRCYFGGLFGTLFLPSILGGDIIRLGLAMRLARNRLGALLGSVIDRILDVTALGSVAALGAALLPGALSPQHREIFWLLVCAGILALAILLAVVALVPARRFSYRMRRGFVRLRQAARSMAREPQYVLLALSLGVAVQTSFVLLTAVIAAGCGLYLPLRVWLFAWSLAKISSVLPVSQGGIGVRELALAALAAPFGAPPALTVAVGLAWEAIILVGGLLAGLLSFLLGRSAGLRSAPAGFPASNGSKTNGSTQRKVSSRKSVPKTGL
jgi:glycosyltransferase 2 family protein